MDTTDDGHSFMSYSVPCQELFWKGCHTLGIICETRKNIDVNLEAVEHERLGSPFPVTRFSVYILGACTPVSRASDIPTNRKMGKSKMVC